jgi:hypothetical protein
MRRKIEKYLAKKQGVDEANIRYMDDGRFDFMGDLEGVLAAVRGKDGSGRGRGKSTGKARKHRKKGNEPTPQPLGALTNMHPGMIHSNGMAYFPHLSPYMAPPGMHPQFMSGPPRPNMTQPPGIKTNGKENSRTPGSAPFPMQPSAQPMGIVSSGQNSRPRENPNFFSFSPAELEEQKERQQRASELLGEDPMNVAGPNGMSPFFGMNATPASTMKTPFHSDTDFSSNYFSSGKKSYFDSPKRPSPTYPDMRGMTPLSHLRDTFSNTPFTGETMKLSPAMYNDELNKTLFGGDEHALSDVKRRFIMKTPKARSPKQITFRIGSDLSSKSGSAADFSQVSISPIAQMASSAARKMKPEGQAAMTDDFSNSDKSLSQVSLASADKPAHQLSTSAPKRKAANTDEEMMPPPVTVSFSESRDDSILSSSTKSTGSILKCSPPFEYRDDNPTPRNVTLDESQMGSIEQSPFHASSILGGMPTPSGDTSFWRTQFGFSPANNSFTPFKSPAPFALNKQEEQYSPVNGALCAWLTV